jgi:anti-sigma factor RsiW
VTAAELTCRELVELVTAYLDDALARPERERFERHLGHCPGCSTYVEQIRESMRLTGEQLREETLSPEARDALLAQFTDWKNNSV